MVPERCVVIGYRFYRLRGLGCTTVPITLTPANAAMRDLHESDGEKRMTAELAAYNGKFPGVGLPPSVLSARQPVAGKLRAFTERHEQNGAWAESATAR